MEFDLKQMPENPGLKKLFYWRGRLVIDCQIENLLNKIGDEIAFHASFVTAMRLSNKPVFSGGKAVLPEGTQITFFTVQNRDGKRFLPIFTDVEELTQWKKDAEGEMVGVRFDDLKPLLTANQASFAGVVINPLTDNFVMRSEVVNQWTARKLAILKIVADQQKKLEELRKKAAEQKAAEQEAVEQ